MNFIKAIVFLYVLFCFVQMNNKSRQCREVAEEAGKYNYMMCDGTHATVASFQTGNYRGLPEHFFRMVVTLTSFLWKL